MAAKIKKYDGVISAVHYAPDGQIQWVRAFQRRGFVFSDRIQLFRADLIDWLKEGKKIHTGQRQYKMGNEFDLGLPVQLVNQSGKDIVIAGEGVQQSDHLEGVPII